MTEEQEEFKSSNACCICEELLDADEKEVIVT